MSVWSLSKAVATAPTLSEGDGKAQHLLSPCHGPCPAEAAPCTAPLGIDHYPSKG